MDCGPAVAVNEKRKTFSKVRSGSSLLPATAEVYAQPGLAISVRAKGSDLLHVYVHLARKDPYFRNQA